MRTRICAPHSSCCGCLFFEELLGFLLCLFFFFLQTEKWKKSNKKNLILHALRLSNIFLRYKPAMSFRREFLILVLKCTNNQQGKNPGSACITFGSYYRRILWRWNEGHNRHDSKHVSYASEISWLVTEWSEKKESFFPACFHAQNVLPLLLWYDAKRSMPWRVHEWGRA